MDRFRAQPFDTIAENDLYLAASRYKLRVAEEMPDEDPAELIREVLPIEKEITDGMDKLLKEVKGCPPSVLRASGLQRVSRQLALRCP